MTSSPWFVYIILTKKNRLYTGITTDVDRRFQEHCGDLPGGAKFFRSDSPLEIVCVISCESRSAALKKEAEIKKLSRPKKEHFINEYKKNSQ